MLQMNGEVVQIWTGDESYEETGGGEGGRLVESLWIAINNTLSKNTHSHPNSPNSLR
jgi:hypothetical protein